MKFRQPDLMDSCTTVTYPNRAAIKLPSRTPSTRANVSRYLPRGVLGRISESLGFAIIYGRRAQVVMDTKYKMEVAHTEIWGVPLCHFGVSCLCGSNRKKAIENQTCA